MNKQTQPTQPTALVAEALRPLIMEITRQLNAAYYFTLWDKDNPQSLFVALTYRNVTVTEVEMALTPEQGDRVANIRGITRSTLFGTGYAYVEIILPIPTVDQPKPIRTRVRLYDRVRFHNGEDVVEGIVMNKHPDGRYTVLDDHGVWDVSRAEITDVIRKA